jgi:hypothetical protein
LRKKWKNLLGKPDVHVSIINVCTTIYLKREHLVSLEDSSTFFSMIISPKGQRWKYTEGLGWEIRQLPSSPHFPFLPTAGLQNEFTPKYRFLRSFSEKGEDEVSQKRQWNWGAR